MQITVELLHRCDYEGPPPSGEACPRAAAAVVSGVPGENVYYCDEHLRTHFDVSELLGIDPLT